VKDIKSVGEVLPEALKDLGLSDVGVSTTEAEPPAEAPTTTEQATETQSQKVGQFASVPYAIINLASDLATSGKARTFAKALKLVILDLVKYTDWNHDDVIITNPGISRRNGIGQAGVKACITMLLKWRVLKKSYPSKSRLAELKRNAPGGFGRGRRYLKWNPHVEWRVPTCENAVADVTKVWERCRGKKSE
jgi:hypothetical protein